MLPAFRSWDDVSIGPLSFLGEPLNELGGVGHFAVGFW